MSGIENKIEAFKYINQLKNKKEQINKLFKNLYEDKISEAISQSTFLELAKDYEKQKNRLNNQIIEIEKQQKNNKNNININQEKFEKKINDILRFDKINEENRSLVFKLIDKIIIEDQTININYRFDIAV